MSFDNIFSQQQNHRYYTYIGDEDFLDDNGFARTKTDNNKVLAKALSNKKSRQLSNKNYQYRYYIKTSPLKNIYNPMSIYSIQNANIDTNIHLHKTYKNEWIFTEVTESIFNKYLEFLKTGNTQWLKAAQQELI